MGGAVPSPVLSPPAWALGKRVLPPGLGLPPWLAGWREPPVVVLWLGLGVVVAQRVVP
jgi:hypothetical protein